MNGPSRVLRLDPTAVLRVGRKAERPIVIVNVCAENESAKADRAQAVATAIANVTARERGRGNGSEIVANDHAAIPCDIANVSANRKRV